MPGERNSEGRRVRMFAAVSPDGRVGAVNLIPETADAFINCRMRERGWHVEPVIVVSPAFCETIDTLLAEAELLRADGLAAEVACRAAESDLADAKACENIQAATIADLRALLREAGTALGALCRQVQAHVSAIDGVDADLFCERQLAEAEPVLARIAALPDERSAG